VQSHRTVLCKSLLHDGPARGCWLPIMTRGSPLGNWFDQSAVVGICGAHRGFVPAWMKRGRPTRPCRASHPIWLQSCSGARDPMFMQRSRYPVHPQRAPPKLLQCTPRAQSRSLGFAPVQTLAPQATLPGKYRPAPYDCSGQCGYRANRCSYPEGGRNAYACRQRGERGSAYGAASKKAGRI
jgi:hypothetical protein